MLMVMARLRERKEWKFFGVLPKADRALTAVWWVALVLRGVLPALFAVSMGVLVGAVQRGDSLVGPLGFVGVVRVERRVAGDALAAARERGLARPQHRRGARRAARRRLRLPPRG